MLQLSPLILTDRIAVDPPSTMLGVWEDDAPPVMPLTPRAVQPENPPLNLTEIWIALALPRWIPIVIVSPAKLIRAPATDLLPLRTLLARGSWTENDNRVAARPASFMLIPTSPAALTGRNWSSPGILCIRSSCQRTTTVLPCNCGGEA